MNKKISLSIFLIGILLSISLFSNLLFWKKIPTNTSYPSVKAGDYVFFTSLIPLKKNNLICFNRQDNETKQKVIWMLRLLGTEGDQVEIKKGDLYINSILVDKSLNISHTYLMRIENYTKIKDNVKEIFKSVYNVDSVKTILTSKEFSNIKFFTKRVVEAESYSDIFIEKSYSKKWNKDNFGPIIVPKDKLFVLGDNRDNSEDSRYFGFIDKENYIATAIGK